MTCLTSEEVELLVRGELEPALASAKRAHIGTCEVCRAAYESCLANEALLGELKQDVSPPVGVAESAQPADTQVSSTALGQQIGSYRLLNVLGEGGMGVVYIAEQEHPRRTVALKLLKPGTARPELLRRFEYEAEVLGRLQHPGIAQIYEAGAADTGQGPQPYFAMELVQGVSLRQYVDDHKLGTRDRLELLAKICDALHHAHQKGIIHRDLKPGNILVTAEGQPKVLDFGVARATDADLQTTTLRTDIGQLIGTVPYMSPEQVSGDPAELDTRSDVYALGVIAYELLAGTPPYDLRRKMVHEAVRIIREETPTPLSSTNRTLRGDVETIVGKALEKEKDRRYQSASDLASDIRRYLADEPIVARPPSAAYQFRKFATRHTGLVAGVSAAFVVLLLATIGMAFLTNWALAEQQRAETEAENARLAEQKQRRLAESESLARAEAEDSRAAEAEQRELAETRAEEIAEARDQLQTVVDFQSSTLSGVDAEAMGRGLLAEIRNGIRETLEARNADAGRIESALAGFDDSVRGVNATNVALEIMDEYVLSRAVATIEQEFGDQPLVRAALQQTVANTYREIGRSALAMPLQEAALRTRRQVLGNASGL